MMHIQKAVYHHIDILIAFQQKLAFESENELIGLQLYVDKSNARAMRVYESMGMDGSHYTVYEWMK